MFMNLLPLPSVGLPVTDRNEYCQEYKYSKATLEKSLEQPRSFFEESLEIFPRGYPRGLPEEALRQPRGMNLQFFYFIVLTYF